MDKSGLQNKEAWWATPLSAVYAAVDPVNGLSSEAVVASRKKFGTNSVNEVKPAGAFSLILEGVREPMMLVLLSIGALSLIFGRVGEAVVMLFVVAAYIAVEFINKYRTGRTMARLRQLTSQAARVIRSGKTQEIPMANIVVGDILLLTEGGRVAADARLIEARGLIADEASLTGESFPVEKNAKALLTPDTSLADRVNSVFSSTMIMSGEGKAVVCAVGRESEFGQIAGDVAATSKEKTVLQQSMTHLAKVLAVFAIAVSIIIPAVGLARGLDFQEMIVTWLALTFLMIPGQPPVIITMALALAAFKLARIKLAVKRLRGVEVLAQTTAVVADKTGTITENRMQVEKFILSGGEELSPERLDQKTKRHILLSLPRYGNDPTDIAVYQAVEGEEGAPTPISFSGFSEDKPYREIGYEIDGKVENFIAGKAERIIDGVADDELRQRLMSLLSREAEQGKRVVAYGIEGSAEKGCEIHFIAMAVLTDSIRDGAAETVGRLRDAAVETFVVTGDHPATARAVAEKIGIVPNVLTGSDIEKMSDQELADALEKTRIFARIAPSQKLRIVKMLKKQGEVVTAIGDGINDAPALVAADVGIAMGQIGTDLAREAADLILTDDNYMHLADAIAISRSAIDNFRKGLTYYLTAKTILLAIFLVPLVLGIPFPFAPIHIILTELLMDLASSTIFVTEAAEPDVMRRGTEKIQKFLGAGLAAGIVRNGMFLATGITILYAYLYFHTGDLALSQTAAFVTWLLGHIALALNLKQRHLPLLRQGILSNRFGALWFFGMIVLSFTITVLPGMHRYLKTSPLSINIWAAIILIVIGSTFWIEIVKLVKFKRDT